MKCKLTTVKRPCPNERCDPIPCWKPDCDGWIHEICCGMLLDKCQIPSTERPTLDDRVPPDNLPVCFCTKKCFTKWRVEKNKQERESRKQDEAASEKPKKVPWKESGALDILMDWLTAHGNYAKHCGATGNKGSSKKAHHKHILLLIKAKVPDFDRLDKDVSNKIVSLETQFKEACDWAGNTGQGVDDPGEFERATLARCPLFKEPEPIMLDRPNAKPLFTNEGELIWGEEDEEEEEEEGFTAVEHSTANDEEDDEEEEEEKVDDASVSPTQAVATAAVATAAAVVATAPSTARKSDSDKSAKRLTSTTKKAPRKRKKRNQSADDFMSSHLGNTSDDDEEGNTFYSLRVREVEAKEQEATARMLEARATTAKTKTETDLSSIDLRVKLLRERKALVDEGVCTEENIDELLPLNNSGSDE